MTEKASTAPTCEEGNSGAGVSWGRGPAWAGARGGTHRRGLLAIHATARGNGEAQQQVGDHYAHAQQKAQREGGALFQVAQHDEAEN